MTNLAAMQQRISDLEIHLAHQDSTIQDLSDITAKQWDTIDDLSRMVELLRNRLLTLEEAPGSENLPNDPPPPHF